MTQSTPPRSMRSFTALLLARAISLLGTNITFFALVFWLYSTTRSVTMLAMAYFCVTVPSLIMTPLARAIMQRWGPRRSLLVSNGGAILTLFILLVPLWVSQLTPWHVYLIIVLRVISLSLDWPAYAESTKAIVPKEQLNRADRMLSISGALPDIVGPFAAGMLLLIIGLPGIILLNIATFIWYLAFLLFTRIPSLPTTADQGAPQPSPLAEARQGLRYIISQPGLRGLLIFFAVTNFSMSMVLILIIPLGLTVAPPALLGAILSLACLGPLVGTVIFARWGTPKRLVQVILGFTLLQGSLLLLGGLRPSLWLIGGAAFAFLACFPIVVGSSQAIWEMKVPPEQHRRSLAARQVIAWSSIPIAQILVGPLSDRVFEPLLAPGSSLAGSLGQLIGMGPGRGIGLLLMMLGILNITAVVAGYAYPRLRMIEREMPDITNQEKVVEARIGVVNAF